MAVCSQPGSPQDPASQRQPPLCQEGLPPPPPTTPTLLRVLYKAPQPVPLPELPHPLCCGSFSISYSEPVWTMKGES